GAARPRRQGHLELGPGTEVADIDQGAQGFALTRGHDTSLEALPCTLELEPQLGVDPDDHGRPQARLDGRGQRVVGHAGAELEAVLELRQPTADRAEVNPL